jgi:hypothetical protein
MFLKGGGFRNMIETKRTIDIKDLSIGVPKTKPELIFDPAIDIGDKKMELIMPTVHDELYENLTIPPKRRF